MISNGLADIKYVLCKKNWVSYPVKHRCEGVGEQVDKLLFSPSSSLSLTSFLNMHVEITEYSLIKWLFRSASIRT